MDISLKEALDSRLVIKGADLQRSLEERDPPPVVSTGIEALDGPAGGLTAGSLIQIAGAGTRGRFSLAMAALQGVTQAGDAAALLDCQNHFDPQQAVGAGIELERLLWITPRHVMQALLGAELLIQSGFLLIVLDSGMAPMPSLPNAVWMRLARAAREHNAIVLISAPFPIETTACDALIYAQEAEAEWTGESRAPKLLAGLLLHLRTQARRGRRGDRSAWMKLRA